MFVRVMYALMVFSCGGFFACTQGEPSPGNQPVDSENAKERLVQFRNRQGAPIEAATIRSLRNSVLGITNSKGECLITRATEKVEISHPEHVTHIVSVKDRVVVGMHRGCIKGRIEGNPAGLVVAFVRELASKEQKYYMDVAEDPGLTRMTPLGRAYIGSINSDDQTFMIDRIYPGTGRFIVARREGGTLRPIAYRDQVFVSGGSGTRDLGTIAVPRR